jgi:hypothetical protein
MRVRERLGTARSLPARVRRLFDGSAAVAMVPSVVLSVVLSVGACGAPTASPSVAAPPSRVSALSFDLPAEPAYRPDGTRIGDDGELVRSWRLELAAGGPSCIVIAGEQPNFTGAFPAAAIAAFRLGQEAGSDVQYNEAVTPPPGTVAGVRQSRSYVFSLGARGTDSGVLLVRQYLTTDHTLISLSVAGPAEEEATCALRPVVDSLRVSSPSDPGPPVVLP